jgi:hypothetical protein
LVKYLQILTFELTCTGLDFFAPPQLHLSLRDESGRRSDLQIPVSITTLNFFTISSNPDTIAHGRFESMAGSELTAVVHSSAAEATFSRQE